MKNLETQTPPKPEYSERGPDWEAIYASLERLNLPIDASDRAADVGSMAAEDLIALVTLIHAAVAPETEVSPVESAMNVTSADRKTKTKLMDPQDRYGYFQRAAYLIHGLSEQVKPGTEGPFLKRAANIIALATVISHPFEDGNGRTARVAAVVVRDGFDRGNEATKQDVIIGATNRPDQGFRIYSFVPRFNDMTPEQYLEAIAGLDIPLDQTDEYKIKTEPLFTTPFGD